MSAGRPDQVELRQLRCLVAVVDAGSFTDAAIELGVSQAAVSRSVAALERALGVRLLRRTTRELAPTATGLRVLTHARRVLAETEALVHEALSGHTRLRLGYAWSALGRHTLAFQRRWAQRCPAVELHLIRTNSPTGGLAEGACDLAVVRRPPDERRFATALLGLERRYVGLAADDPWARRRSVRLAEIAERTVLIDRRTGTTTADLWPRDGRPPALEYIHDIDDWLTTIATGRAVGITAESTAVQYPRPGVVYRPVRDAEPIPVRLAWWRDAPHPATADVIALATELYRA